MATNFPTSKQTFTNPSSGDNLDSPSHSGQHADENDTIEAVQDKVGTAASNNAPASNKFLRGTGANTSEWDIDFKDEDDMSSDSATALSSQQSVKAYVDTNAAATGWIDAGETWTYASSDDPTYTFTIPAFDATTKYSVGMRIKLTDSGTQYFIITKVVFDDPGSTITVFGGTDYDLSTGAITNPFYSTQTAPLDFPLDPDKWTVEVADTTTRTQASPTNGTWYNLGSILINVPIGSWVTSYEVTVGGNHSSGTRIACEVTLSTANNSESDAKWTANGDNESAQRFYYWAKRERAITIATKDTYYLNAQSIISSIDNLEFRNTNVTATIRAVSAYL